jgi:RNA recognition motif-containing protein
MNNNVMETKLYVGNLSYETTEDDLRRLFTQFGTVNKVALIKDRDTGSFKGFAFVTMNSPEEANKAIEQFSWRNLGSRELKVNIARPRAERPWSSYDSNQLGSYGSNSQNRGGDRGY